MGEDLDSVKPSFCYGCLRKNEDNPLHFYQFQNIALKSILQGEQLCFCFLCKRRAENTELFIKSVHNNQLLLREFQGQPPDSTFDISNSQHLPQLSYNKLPLIEIEGESPLTDSEEFYVTVHNSWNRDNVEDDHDVKYEIKVESYENDGFDSFAEDDSKDIVQDIKEEQLDEDECSLKTLKQELQLELESVNRKYRKYNLKSKKKAKIKRKKKQKVTIKDNKKKKEKDSLREDKPEDYMESITISRAQCMKERKEIASSEKYINFAFKCEDCVKGFSFNKSYDTHMEMHNKIRGEYICDICKQRYRAQDQLTRHQKYHYVRFKCTLCNLTRINRSSIKDHYTAVHCKGFSYTCCYCSKLFKCRTAMRKHIQYVHKNKERVSDCGKVQCGHCNKYYVSKNVLQAHLIRMHPTEVSATLLPKRHVCEQCGAAFSAPSQLRNHSIKHEQWRGYYCVECDKSFKSNEILKHHLKTAMSHIKYADLPLHCGRCDKRFAIKRDLDRHMNRVHLNIKPYQCDKCDRAYVNSWSLNEHKRMTHEGYKRPLRFPCTMCDKVFDRNQILKGHIRTHTGERPYQCKLCGAAFGQASSLGTHVRLVHLRLTRDGRTRNANTVAGN